MKNLLKFYLVSVAGLVLVTTGCNLSTPYVSGQPPSGSPARAKAGGEVVARQQSGNANSGQPSTTPQQQLQTSSGVPAGVPNDPIPQVVVGVIKSVFNNVPTPAAGSQQKTPAPVSPVSQSVEATVPQATCPMYANTNSSLYCVRDNGSELISSFKYNGMTHSQITDIAISLTGRIYAISPTMLFLVNPNNADLTLVRSIDTGNANALTVLSDGRLVVAGHGVSVLDLQNNVLQTLSSTSSYNSSGDIVGLPDKKLYWTISTSVGDQLAVVDVFAGTIRVLGKIGYNQVLGLGFSNNTLYGFNDMGNIFTINQQTGAAGQVIRSESARWWGATTNPVRW